MQIWLKQDLGKVFLGRLSFANSGINIGDGIRAGKPPIFSKAITLKRAVTSEIDGVYVTQLLWA